MEYKLPRLDEIDQELQRYPSAVTQEYRRAHELLSAILEPQQLVVWAEQGVAMASQTVRSWEAASDYFRASPDVLPQLTFDNLFQWTNSGQELCVASPTLASAYFRASASSLPYLAPRQIPDWGALGRALYKGTWRSSALTCKFFEISPHVLRTLSLPQLEQFARFIDVLSQRSYDLAQECLALGPEVFPSIGDSREAFISLVSVLAEGTWREVKGCFEAAVDSLPRIERRQQARFLGMAERLAQGSTIGVSGFIAEGAQALGHVDPALHRSLLTLGETLLGIHPPALPQFLRSVPTVLEQLSPAQLNVWFEEGARLLIENNDSGMAFFSLESARAEEMLENLSSAVEFVRVKDIMRLYCRALAGAHVEVAPAEDLAKKGIGWVSKERPTTEGSSVYLPPQMDDYGTKEENFAWLKVIATHQVGHLEFGSFDFLYEKTSTLFPDLRPALPPAPEGSASPVPRPTPDADEGMENGLEAAWLTDMQRFFDLFPDRQMALDIFTVVEDGRLDAHVLNEYRGIRPQYDRVQSDSLSARPPMEGLPAREALVEFLVRLSLRQDDGVSVPAEHIEAARDIGRTAHRVFAPDAAVEDAAEATIRIYAVLAQIKNEQVPEDGWEDLDPDDLGDYQETPASTKLQPAEGGSEEGDDTMPATMEQGYASPQEVQFRGDFKPETVQLLAQLKMSQELANQGDATPLTREMLEELLKENVEIETSEGEAKNNTSAFANNMMREAGMPLPPPESLASQTPMLHADDDGDSLEATEPQTHLYDEWDFRADDYRPRWCIVREKVMAEGDVSFWHQTLVSNAPLVASIRRQFELTVPQAFRKIRHLQDGEEFDLDSVVDAMIDRRLGLSPSDHIYARRNKTERDVAVLFLLDMSASTAEAIDEAKRMADSWDAPDDPADYLHWLRNRRTDPPPRRAYKRIIDLEKESVVLLTQALETLGDKYGFYGFSGYGRENVEFYTIKDLHEPMSEKVRQRVDKINPLHATRMGPAIRHSITKLEDVEAKTKILFLISDGRPQDRGYSREGVEKEYAVHDTRMALVEAKRKGINPFCLTVDKAGHDYLKTMMGDMGYEVLHEISALPRRLPYLYQKLTV